jgi:hypothetical protein
MRGTVDGHYDEDVPDTSSDLISGVPAHNDASDQSASDTSNQRYVGEKSGTAVQGEFEPHRFAG